MSIYTFLAIVVVAATLWQKSLAYADGESFRPWGRQGPDAIETGEAESLGQVDGAEATPQPSEGAEEGGEDDVFFATIPTTSTTPHPDEVKTTTTPEEFFENDNNDNEQKGGESASGKIHSENIYDENGDDAVGNDKDDDKSHVNCSNAKLPSVLFGRISHHGGSSLGATRRVLCYPAYVLTGHKVIQCRRGGWTAPGECRHVSEKYYLVKGAFTWNDAVIKCMGDATRLATAKTGFDHALIVNAMLRESVNLAWIGLSRINYNHHNWTWVDGTTLDADRDFQPWIPGKPAKDPEEVVVRENCVQVHLVKKPWVKFPEDDPDVYGWRNFPCAVKFSKLDWQNTGISVVCERI